MKTRLALIDLAAGIRRRAVFFANESASPVIDAIAAILVANELKEDGWVQLSPFGRFPNAQGLQEFGREDAEAIVNDDTITIPNHLWATGAAARFFSFGVLPAGLVAGTLYYLRKDGDDVTVHPTRADALANTNKVNITDAGTGTHRVIEQEPLVVVSSEGERYTFHVAALGALPAINGTSADTLIGEVTFQCFRKAGVAATTADSLFTLDTAEYTPPAIDPTKILTQAYSFTWGAAPWADLETVSGIRFEFALNLVDVPDDALGVSARRVDSVSVTARATPLGIAPADVLAKLKLQGAGAQRGGSLASTDNLVMAGTGVQVTMTNAALRNAPHAFGRSVDRVGELELFANRKFDAGVPQPLFTVGTGA